MNNNNKKKENDNEEPIKEKKLSWHEKLITKIQIKRIQKKAEKTRKTYEKSLQADEQAIIEYQKLKKSMEQSISLLTQIFILKNDEGQEMTMTDITNMTDDEQITLYEDLLKELQKTVGEPDKK